MRRCQPTIQFIEFRKTCKKYLEINVLGFGWECELWFRSSRIGCESRSGRPTQSGSTNKQTSQCFFNVQTNARWDSKNITREFWIWSLNLRKCHFFCTFVLEQKKNTDYDFCYSLRYRSKCSFWENGKERFPHERIALRLSIMICTPFRTAWIQMSEIWHGCPLGK